MDALRWKYTPRTSDRKTDLNPDSIWNTLTSNTSLLNRPAEYQVSQNHIDYQNDPHELQPHQSLALPRWWPTTVYREKCHTSLDVILTENIEGILSRSSVGASSLAEVDTFGEQSGDKDGFLGRDNLLLKEDGYPTATDRKTPTIDRVDNGCDKQLAAKKTPNRNAERNSNNGQGIWLLWKDLWVTVSVRNDPNQALLHGLTGYAIPGDILAIMGPSGSGKSTLLDTLAGRLSPNVQHTGQIFVNGQSILLSYGYSAYVTQDDVLMETLTAREAILYSARMQLPSSMSNKEKGERAESTIIEMGLQDIANHRIGGWRNRGLSGGEKRRVSIAIQILTRPPLLFLDEPTSGLDSAASYHVMKRIRYLATTGKTVILSIHQPSTDVFELFNTLYLLSKGKTIYFGEAVDALEFFASNGFRCPPMCNPPDHYVRMINSDFDIDKYIDVEGGVPDSMLRTEQVVDALVKDYQQSNIKKAVFDKMDELSNKAGEVQVLCSDHGKFFTQVCVLTVRSFKNMYRDLGYYWLRLAIYVALCLCVGTVYYKVGNNHSSIQARGAMLMFVAAFLTFMAIGGFPSFVEDMKVFERERLNGHYGVAAYVISNTLSSIPFLLLISTLPGSLAYFLVDLHHGVHHFLYFVLTLFACMIVVESLMMMVASVVPDFLMGIITGAGIQGIFMLSGGFFRLPNDLPKPFWKYPMSYLAFHTYANQGFYKNDFQGLNFESNVIGSPPISGDSILRNDFQVTMTYSKWVDLAILIAMAIFYRLIFFSLVKLKEKVRRTLPSKLSK